MPTTAQEFFLKIADVNDELTGENDVRALHHDTFETTQPNETVADFGTNTASRAIAFNPFNHPNGSPNTTAMVSGWNGHGWAFEQDHATDDSLELGATSDAYRIVPAGNWPVRYLFSTTVAATITMRCILYKVNAAGVGTQIGFLGQTEAGAGSQTKQVRNTNISGIAEQVLAPGETIVAEFSVVAAGVAVLGQQVRLYTRQETIGALPDRPSISVPAPGIRTQYMRGPSDTALASEVSTRLVHFPRAVLDTTLVSDTPSRSAGVFRRLIPDAARAVDSLVRLAQFYRELSDTALASDVPTRAVIVSRPILDTVPEPVDIVTRSQGVFRRLVPDEVFGYDVATRSTIQFRSTVDNLPEPLDVAVRFFHAFRAPTDTAIAADVVSRSNFVGARLLFDTALAEDSLFRSANFVRSVEENIGSAGGGIVIEYVYVPVHPFAGDVLAPWYEAQSIEQPLIEGTVYVEDEGTVLDPVTAGEVLSADAEGVLT